VLNASAIATIYGAGAVCEFGLGTTPTGYELDFNIVGQSGGNDSFKRYYTVTSAAVKQVSAGNNTFYLTADKGTSLRRVDLRHVKFSAIFVSNRY
jgi:hypothetical protein